MLTSIDTREVSQLHKVILPYGHRHKSGSRIPKNTILFGQLNYPGNGNKVYLTFNRGIFPNGKEFRIFAQALSTSDFSPGITENFHGNSGTRIATTLGLTMVSGMSEVMTEKRALGQNGQETVRAKATAKNALYHGLSKASELEANRQLNKLGQDPEYVTVQAGKDLIVSILSTSFK